MTVCSLLYILLSKQQLYYIAILLFDLYSFTKLLNKSCVAIRNRFQLSSWLSRRHSYILLKLHVKQSGAIETVEISVYLL